MADPNRLAVIGALFGCGETTAEEIVRFARWCSVDAGDPALHQGSRHDACSLVVRGSANLMLLGKDGRYVKIATVEIGEPFGVYPNAEIIAADVVAQGALEYVSVEAIQLARIAGSRADLGSALAQMFARQLHGIVGRFAARLTLSAAGRVYEQLFFALDAERKIAPVPVVAALAVQAQTTRETASRAISSLERRGILERRSDHWLVNSPRMLEDMLV